MTPEQRASRAVVKAQELLARINHLVHTIGRDYKLELKWETCKYGPITMFIPDMCIFAYNEVVAEFGSFDPEEDSIEEIATSLGLFGLDWELWRLSALFVELSIVQTYKNPEWDFLEIDPTWMIVEAVS